MIVLADMNERELLSAILYEVQNIRAKVDKTADDLLNFQNDMNNFQNDMNNFRNEMNQFRNETNNNFNKIERRLRFVEADYNQLNERVDKLERTGT